MPKSFRSLLILLALAGGLSGCGTMNEKLSSGMGDYVPQWAGGLPADAPPRAGTPQYDAYMKERERKRLMPAADREKEEQEPLQPAAPRDEVKAGRSRLDPAQQR
ncbi:MULTISPECIES: hypothetical protein [unclassified Bradyrhizobium]|uniref:hypothetical protein n=1 Tax=unclassified Bradyrhizobium TaxID=2631580 RepID=UPI001FF7E5CA|nr:MULTISPECIES: hypothetical protein [unclassified Bradyrhizobium]